MDNLLISVIVPVFNVENEIDRCVKSIITQTYQNLEILLIDDGSTDHCPDICDQHAKEDSRIRVFHKKNGGLSDARNFGLSKAQGDYILFVDSDDYIQNDACEKLIHLTANGVDIVVGECRQIKNSIVTYQKHSNIVPFKKYSSKEYIISSIKKNELFFPIWLNLYRKDFLIQNNLFFKKGYYFEDMEFTIRFWLNNPIVVYLNYPFYNYVIRSGSIMTSSAKEKKQKDSLAILQEWFALILTIQDIEYRSYWLHYLVKIYITCSRLYNIKGWRINNLNFKFSFLHAKTIDLKAKVVIFTILSKFWI